MESATKELIDLLEDSSMPTEIKENALKYLLGMTATKDGIQLFSNEKELLKNVIRLVGQNNEAPLTELACKCLLNVTSSISGANSLFSCSKDFVVDICREICDPSIIFLDLRCKILSNATRSEVVCSYITEQLSKNFKILCDAIHSFNCSTSHDYDMFALFLGNISQNESMRRTFLSVGFEVLKSLTSYTMYPHSKTRRHGVVILLKNLSFEVELHKKILEELDILPSLLLPLIGPEELDEDEMEKLPIVCQYLGSEKEREPEIQIRIMLLEALLKLCSTRYGRNYLRENGVYYVLREHHKWETESSAIRACEDVVEILIRDEPDVGADNFMNIEIPESLSKKLDDLNVKDDDASNPEITLLE